MGIWHLFVLSKTITKFIIQDPEESVNILVKAFVKYQDYSKKLTNTIKITNTIKSIKKLEKKNSSKNQFKSKYAVQKIVRRMPFYVSTALKRNLLKSSMVETKVLVKNTIKSLRDIDLDFRKIYVQNHPDLTEKLKYDESFPLLSGQASYYRKSTKPEHSTSTILSSKEEFCNEGLANVCKLYRKEQSSFYNTARTPYDRYFSDMNNSRLNFEYRKHSGIRILLRGDLLGALNCFFPQLSLVPSEGNPKKPVLNQSFSNYSHTYKELEESFSLARKYRKELFQQPSNNYLNNFHKEKQSLKTSVDNFVQALENCEFKRENGRNYLNSKNSIKPVSMNQRRATLYELKPTRANTSLKPGNLKEIPVSGEHKNSTVCYQEEKLSQFGIGSKSEPQLNKKVNVKEPLKNIFLNTKNSVKTKKKIATSPDFSISKGSLHTFPDKSYCDISISNNENIYPDRVEDLHALEGVVNELNAFIDKSSSSKPPERCTYSSVLKNSFIPGAKKILTNYFEEKCETELLEDDVQENLNKIEVLASVKIEANTISKPKVIYNEKEFEKSLRENIERLLEEDPMNSENFYKGASSMSELYTVQPNAYMNATKMQYQSTIKNQLISKIPQIPQPAVVQSSFTSPKRVSNMYEIEAFNKFIQQKFHSQNMNRLNQNFGNLLSKISLPQQSSSMFSQKPQFSVGPPVCGVEHGNKSDLRNSQNFQVLQNQASATPQMNSSFCTHLNRDLLRSSMTGNSSKVDLRTIISASDLEKQAIEQYRQSEESLNSRYDVLEREAEEQYNNFNGHK